MTKLSDFHKKESGLDRITAEIEKKYGIDNTYHFRGTQMPNIPSIPVEELPKQYHSVNSHHIVNLPNTITVDSSTGIEINLSDLPKDPTKATYPMASQDNVNNPKHYKSSKHEAIDVIEDWKLDFCLGNTVKYISRAGKKDKDKEIEDLEKARWYLDRKINQLKGNK